jgi:hypothetical protein
LLLVCPTGAEADDKESAGELRRFRAVAISGRRFQPTRNTVLG